MPKIPLSKKLKSASINQPVKPLWDGPESDSDNGGVTQGLLCKFLNDREKLRVLAIEGLRPKEDFSHYLHYGQMWHTCEQALSGVHINRDPRGSKDADQALQAAACQVALVKYCQGLAAQFPMKQAEIMHWYNICRVQFPCYIDWWKKHPQIVDREPLMQEVSFNVKYRLPSGRTVILRGKWDEVDICGKPVGDSDYGIWLQENKTKGELDAKILRRQLTFDLQTMLYLVALDEEQDNSFWRRANKRWRNIPIRGVRYNLVRRPLAGGKGSIRQKKNQSEAEFYEELGGIIQGAVGQEWGVMPDEHYFFMRWNVNITPMDIQKFKDQTLNPLLEELCDWYAWMISAKTPIDVWNPERQLLIKFGDGCDRAYRTISSSVHYRTPLGVYFDNDRISPEDEYISSGDRLGLERQTVMYRELVNEQ